MKQRYYAALWLLMLVVGMQFVLQGSAVASAITTTKHNLSTTGPGTYRATDEDRVCLVCHTPHNSDPAGPLWNHTLSGETYTAYASTTLVAAPGQPTGNSKLCLACHDGMVALGSVHNMEGSTTSAGIIPGLEDMLTGEAKIGTDLTDDHPVSFVYDNDLFLKNIELKNPAELTGDVQVDQLERLQCTSCHDPHSEQYPKFLRMGYTSGGFGSPLCLTCHVKTNWETSSHRNSTAVLIKGDVADPNPWHLEGHNLEDDFPDSTPKANGCESCHKPHSGTGGRHLLKGDGEQEVCLPCHGGGNVLDPLNLTANVSDPATPTWNVETALNKDYAHPVLTTDGLHSPVRDVADTYNVRESAANLGTNRHAECQDCHNPHQASAGTSPNLDDVGGLNNAASNVLKGVWGVEPSFPGAWGEVTVYDEIDNIEFQYQLCFKCHSYYAFGDTPPTEPYGKYAAWYIEEDSLTDQAKEFNPANASYHPVVAAGKNDFKMTVAGTACDPECDYSGIALLTGVTPTSTMTCSDCHSDSTPTDGAMKGPHGTDVWPILWGPYDGTTGAVGTLDHLCFKCHNPLVYGPDGDTRDWFETGFSGATGMAGEGVRKNLHARHIVSRDMSCIACHAGVPHGWKRRSMLVFGMTTAGFDPVDPEPYNAHVRFPIQYSWDPNLYSTEYGLNSAMGDISEVTYPSGNWVRNDCHGAGTGTGLGC